MKFELPKLPYKELPGFSAKLLEYHHGKHHKGYVDNLNKLIEGTKYEDMDLEEIVKTASGKVYNNAAQHWNHSFYWQCMTDKETELTDKARDNLGDIDKLKKNLIDSGSQLFGSGWVSLTLLNGNITFKKHQNAGSPIELSGTPVLIVDVWEHAYYVDYYNDRGKYLEAFWKVINWEFVSKNIEGT